MKRVRIASEDTVGYKARVTDADTGESIDNVFRVEIDFNANQLITAKLTCYSTVLDLIADAEIQHICPCCGKPDEGQAIDPPPVEDEWNKHVWGEHD